MDIINFIGACIGFGMIVVGFIAVAAIFLMDEPKRDKKLG